VLGTLEVDQEANLANWMIPGKMVPGMGGAMDLVTGARRVILATTHTNKKGEPKILRKCRLPLTGKAVVSLIVTEFAVLRFREGKLVLEEIAPEVTLDQVRAATEAEFVVADPLLPMKGVEKEEVVA
jgi:3-oxoacid CoA-transferase subunit B/acetate CoA/acetoacetate CoA-transferase beta subunit